MTEGKGYCARRQEHSELKKLSEFIENKNNIIIIPDIVDTRKKIYRRQP
ncbi:MAG: hypothetical protein V1915_02655 [Candidatus Bathyarchaeota archaeon]